MPEHAQTRKALDLLSLSHALPRDQGKLRGLIERFASAASIRNDLRSVIEMLNSLDVVQREMQAQGSNGAEHWSSSATLALMNYAILLYVRATKTKSRHRRGFDFRGHYDAKELELHTHFSNLRDDAVAHYGPGDTLQGESLHKDVLFFPLIDPDDTRLMFGSRRILKFEIEQAKLRQLAHRALMIAERVRQERDHALVNEINNLMEKNDPMIEELRHHIVDLSEIFISEEEADFVLGADKGRPITVVGVG